MKGPDTKATVALGIVLVFGVELLLLMLRQRQFLLPAAGAVLACLLFGVRRLAGGSDTNHGRGQANSDDASGALQHWLSGTETRIHWAESTRTDWDRHWRPILARRFEIATGQRQAKDPAAFAAVGKLLFGDRLWEWVDPANVARDGSRQPGPGRVALEDMLLRLEQQ